jgi:D-glycero-D-manno-heptose 1,7-bisphosphate phosphatase
VRAAVFIDRDGTLIEEVGFLNRVDRVELYPWSIDAVRVLNRRGLRVIVVTNQSGVARGLFPESVVGEVHRHIAARLEEGGARIDAYYYCPHHPDGRIAAYARPCECRKPGRGLVDRAVAEFGIDPSQSFVAGDRAVDVDLAAGIGARSVLVRTGYGLTEEAQLGPDRSPDAIVDNLIAAASWILRHVE